MRNGCVTSWSNLEVGRWYRLPSGYVHPIKFAGAFCWEDETEAGTSITGKPILARAAGWYPMPVEWIDKNRGTHIAVGLPMKWKLDFTKADGTVMTSYGLNEHSDLLFFEPASARRRYETNAERQQAYRERMKADKRAYIKVDDRIILPIDGVATKFKVVYVPHTETDLRRGKGYHVRLSNILLEQV